MEYKRVGAKRGLADAATYKTNCKLPIQGSYPFSKQISRTFPGLRLIFQGL